MKITSLFLCTTFVLLFCSFVHSNSVENAATVEAKNSYSATNNANSGIFESITKYKLKAKNKTKKARTGAKKEFETSRVSVPEKPKNPLASLGINVLTAPKSGPSPMPEKVVQGPILWKGWVKFFVYATSDDKKLSSGKIKQMFYKNPEFHDQFKRDQQIDINEVVDKEFKNVHDQYSFFLSVFDDNLNFSQSRIVRFSLIIEC